MAVVMTNNLQKERSLMNNSITTPHLIVLQIPAFDGLILGDTEQVRLSC